MARRQLELRERAWVAPVAKKPMRASWAVLAMGLGSAAFLAAIVMAGGSTEDVLGAAFPLGLGTLFFTPLGIYALVVNGRRDALRLTPAGITRGEFGYVVVPWEKITKVERIASRVGVSRYNRKGTQLGYVALEVEEGSVVIGDHRITAMRAANRKVSGHEFAIGEQLYELDEGVLFATIQQVVDGTIARADVGRSEPPVIA